MPELSDRKREPASIGEEWAKWFKENRTEVEQQNPATQSLIFGLQKLGLTIENAIAQFRTAFEERMKLYPKLHAQVLPLARRGWFLSGAMGISDLMALADVCETSTADDLDAHVAALYRSDIKVQMKEILQTYPHRAFALHPALEAHQRGEYALSVPIFFAQADGIAFEDSKRYLFLNKKGEALRDVAAEELKALEAGAPTPLILLEMMMWQPLAEPLPVGYSQKERDSHSYNGLNRNTVLHGIALCEYATEENSLKAFSMLSYVASLMSQRKSGDT